MSCLNGSTFVLSRKSLSLYQSRSKLILSAQINQSVVLFARSLPPFQWKLLQTDFNGNYSKTVFEDKSSSSNHKDVSKNSGFSPQIIPCLIGFSIIFTIHFGVPLFLETPISWGAQKISYIARFFSCFEPEGWSQNPRDPRWLVHHPNSSSIPEKAGVICFQISSMFGELVWNHYRYTPAWHDNWHYVGTIHVFRFLGRVRVSMDASFIQMRSISA